MRNPDLTKERILNQSGTLFNIQGYKATSLSDITDATGLTKGAIYRHFSSKEELENQALRYLSSVMFEKMRGFIREQSTAGNKLRAVFRYFASYLSQPPLAGGCPLLNAAIEADDAHPVLRKTALEMLKVQRDSIIHILRKGIQYGQIKPGIDPELYATVIIASLEGAIMMSKLSGEAADIERVVGFLEDQIKAIET